MADAIANGSKPPIELLGHHYRKLYGLSYKELCEEPLPEFFTNLHIESLIKKQEERLAKHGNS